MTTGTAGLQRVVGYCLPLRDALGGRKHDGGITSGWWARKDLNLGPMDYESQPETAGFFLPIESTY
ncbi:MAG: hypothetical protein ABSD20_16030 [Terriglobales bacterium]